MDGWRVGESKGSPAAGPGLGTLARGDGAAVKERAAWDEGKPPGSTRPAGGSVSPALGRA
jgi:hypothetical protein